MIGEGHDGNHVHLFEGQGQHIEEGAIFHVCSAQPVHGRGERLREKHKRKRHRGARRGGKGRREENPTPTRDQEDSLKRGRLGHVDRVDESLDGQNGGHGSI